MIIRVEGLTKTFGRTKAVDNVSFSFDSGHIYGFVGPNGAGKTTTMRIIATLEEPDSGDVFINGVSVREQPEVARRRVGYVPDSLPAHNDITVHEYLDFYARAYGLRGGERVDAVAAIEEFTGVSGILDKHLKALSKGMKQRVTLGRALVHDPDVLVLDEPAAGLDPRARVELRELLSVLSEQKKAVLISSHILTELTEICHGVVIIEKGQVLETGGIDEVLKKRSPKRAMIIRPVDRREALFKELLQSPHVGHAKETGRELIVELEGEDDDAAKLLADLVGKGFRIAEFKQTKTNLEDIFMNVTKGGVQ